MFCRQKKKIFLTVFITLILFSAVNFTYAAWWEVKKSLPVPSDTQETKREERLIIGNKFDFIYYASNSEIAAIKSFYRNQLAASGWVEQQLKQDLNRVPAIKIDVDMEQLLERNLSFTRDEEQLIITFLPRQYSPDNKTRFTVSYGKIAKDFNQAKEAPPLSVLLAKPKKDVTPVFPGASLITLSEGAKSLKANYTAKADIEDVLAFYRENMPGYGWSLIGEKPIDIKSAAELPGLGLKACPSCKGGFAAAGNAGIELSFGELDFSNDAGDTCRIMASHAKSPQGAASPLSITTILVDYEEKK